MFKNKNKKKLTQLNKNSYTFLKLLCIALIIFDVSVTCVSIYKMMNKYVVSKVLYRADKIYDYVDNSIKLGDSLSKSDIIINKNTSLKEKVKKTSYCLSDYNLFSIGVSDSKGNIYSSNGGNVQKGALMGTGKIQNCKGIKEYKEAMLKNKPVVSKTYFLKHDYTDRYFSIWCPYTLKGESKPSGAIMMISPFNKLENMAKEESVSEDGTYFSLYNEDSLCIVSRKSSEVGKTFSELSKTFYYITIPDKLSTKNLKENKDFNYIKINNEGIHYDKMISIKNCPWFILYDINIFNCFGMILTSLLIKVFTYIGIFIILNALSKKYLQDQENVYAWVMDGSDQVFIVQQSTKNIEYVSDNIYDITGVKKEDFLLNPYALLKNAIKEEDKFFDKNKLVGFDDLSFTIAILNPVTKKNMHLLFHIYKRINKGVEYWITSISDKTEDVKKNNMLEASLNEVNKANNVKTEFLSRMSHELKTPINGIKGMSLIARENINDEEIINSCLDSVDKSTYHLTNIVNDILDVSKFEKEEINIKESRVQIEYHELLDDILMPLYDLAQEKNIDIRVKNDCKDLRGQSVLVDRNKLERVIISLITNAIKVAPENGKIRISIKYVKKNTNKILLYFSVRDNGNGIQKEKIKDIFNALDNVEDNIGYEGAGLGLYIAKKIIESMGGKLKAESEEGKGSLFYFVIPLELLTQSSTDVPNNKENLSKSQHIRFDNKRILIAEDNYINREILKTFLVNHGAQIDEAVDGKEAVEKFKDSSENYYNAILMDIRMPILGGIEACKQIRNLERKDSKNIPIIAVTADSFNNDVKLSISAGMTAHINKPIDKDKLFRVLNSLINNKKQE